MLQSITAQAPSVNSPSLSVSSFPPKVSSLAKDIFPNKPLAASTRKGSFAVSLLKYTSLTGVLAGVVVVISGLAINMLGVVGIGIFLASSSMVGLYSAYLFASLKDLDAYNRELLELNQSLQHKNEQIQNLNKQLRQALGEFSAIQEKYWRLLKDDQAAQENLQQQLATTELKLQQTVEAFGKVQTDASATLAKTVETFEKQEGELQKEIEEEVAQIALLKKTVDQAKAENDRLHEEVASLQGALADYVQQNKDYAKQNELLEQQVKALGQLPSRPSPIDISGVTAHAKVLQDLLIHQNSEADKVIRSVDQLKEIMVRINALKTQRKVQNDSGFDPTKSGSGTA